jgi:hypothetical protein
MQKNRAKRLQELLPHRTNKEFFLNEMIPYEMYKILVGTSLNLIENKKA